MNEAPPTREAENSLARGIRHYRFSQLFPFSSLNDTFTADDCLNCSRYMEGKQMPIYPDAFVAQRAVSYENKIVWFPMTKTAITVATTQRAANCLSYLV